MRDDNCSLMELIVDAANLFLGTLSEAEGFVART